MTKQGLWDCGRLPVNISEKQRIVSGIAGGALLALGILDFKKSSLRKAIRLATGALLLMRGISGYCPATAMKESMVKPKIEDLDAEI